MVIKQYQETLALWNFKKEGGRKTPALFSLSVDESTS